MLDRMRLASIFEPSPTIAGRKRTTSLTLRRLAIVEKEPVILDPNEMLSVRMGGGSVYLAESVTKPVKEGHADHSLSPGYGKAPKR